MSGEGNRTSVRVLRLSPPGGNQEVASMTGTASTGASPEIRPNWEPMRFLAPQSFRLKHNFSRVWSSRSTFVALGLVIFASNAIGQTQEALPSPSALKKLSVEELMDIEVTSVSKRPEKLSETASAIQVITQEDIRRSGATSLPEALRLASNLEVAQVDSRQWAIGARGFNNTTANKLLVLIDGRTVYTPLFSGVFWDVQDTLLEDIDRIEVISGPGATLWGANAVNGVINIITKKAQDTQGTLLSGGGGSQLRGFGTVRQGGAFGPNLRYRIYGKYFDRDSTVFATGQDGHDSWHSSQFGFRSEWNTSRSDIITLQGDLYDGRANQATTNEIGLGGGNFFARWDHPTTGNPEPQ